MKLYLVRSVVLLRVVLYCSVCCKLFNMGQWALSLSFILLINDCSFLCSLVLAVWLINHVWFLEIGIVFSQIHFITLICTPNYWLLDNCLTFVSVQVWWRSILGYVLSGFYHYTGHCITVFRIIFYLKEKRTQDCFSSSFSRIDFCHFKSRVATLRKFHL